MLGWGKAAGAAGATADPGRRQDLYQRHAAALYRQALLILEDPAQAGQVVRDVITDACGPGSAAGPAPETGEDDTRAGLAEAVFRRCHELIVGRRGDQGRPLSDDERAALGLVLYGGLGYVRASVVLGISARDMAGLLRAALLRLAIPAQRPGLADEADGAARADRARGA